MLRRAAALLAVLAAVVVLPAPVAVAQVVGPQVPVEVDVRGLRASCSGDTVRAVADLDAASATEVVVQLLVQDGPGGFRPLGEARRVDVPAGRSALDVALPGGSPTGRAYRVEVSAGGRTRTSPPVQLDRCAPATVVPEVPAAVLVPLTLSVTGALVVRSLRRRRA